MRRSIPARLIVLSIGLTGAPLLAQSQHDTFSDMAKSVPRELFVRTVHEMRVVASLPL
jgi:hypothetical protein